MIILKIGSLPHDTAVIGDLIHEGPKFRAEGPDRKRIRKGHQGVREVRGREQIKASGETKAIEADADRAENDNQRTKKTTERLNVPESFCVGLGR